MVNVALENLMYELSGLFLTPVLILILAGFVFAFFQLGVFLMEIWQRNKYAEDFNRGYPIHNYHQNNNINDVDKLELYAFKKLELIALVTRVAPMLGLVATMIPMGPALKALSDGNVQGISENLMIAFSAVILALITASITSWITHKRKGWYAQEVITIKEQMQ
jgi:biopolymer transport protein ExbB/TolQ